MSTTPTIGRWNIIKEGKSLIEFQSFLEVDNTQEAKAAQQTIEEGAFVNYNKTVNPEQFTVQLGLQGSVLEIISAVEIIKTELKDASLLQILTPLGVSDEVTLIKRSWTQNVTNGNGMLLVSLTLQEIKQVSPSYTDTQTPPIKEGQAKSPSDVSNTNSGKQQAKEPSNSALKNTGWLG